MENTLKPTLFVEFYGLPGCGKSTISHAVAKLLQEKGFSAEEPSYDIDHLSNTLLRKIKKLIITFVWFVIHNRLCCEISSIVGENKYTGISKIEQISNIIQKVRIYRKKSTSQIVLWDQGLVQASISLSVNGYKTANENLRELYKLISSDLHIYHILISIDSETAVNRMALRKTNYSRVEKLKDVGERDRMLKSFIEGIAEINREFDGEKIDGKMDKEKLSRQVLKIINGKY